MLEENRFENMLASLRVRKGWTQEDAAAHIGKGMSRHTYSDLETGNRPPSPKHLKLIATGFKLDQADTDALYHAAHHGSPKIRHLPFDRNLLFTGRDTYLEQLDELFKAGNRVALTGLAGIGKTQLALEYAYCCFPNVFRAVLWVNAADKRTLEQSYDELAQKLELPELDEQELEKRVQAVKQYLEDHTNWLLIMDNADDLPLARSFFPKAHHGRILLTTRTQIVGSIARNIDIGKMEQEEGLLFLLRRSGELQGNATLDSVAADIREAASQVVELLDGHPLALDQAGAYIEEGVSFTEYIKLYEEERSYLLRRRGSLKGEDSDYPDTVVVTFELCFRKAFERHPLSSDILHFCSFLHPDAIPAELFQHDNSFKLDRSALKEGIIALRRYSLIKRNAHDNIVSLHQLFSMHRLVQAVLIDAMPPDLQMQWRERVVHAVQAAFPLELVFEFENWRQCERLLPHALVCATWSEDELAQTLRAASLFHKAGIYLSQRGQYPEAERLLTRVLPIYKQHFVFEHQFISAASNDLASVYYHQGRYEQALPLFQQAFAINRKLLGIAHSNTAKIMNNLAALYIKQGKYEQAEPLLKRVCSIRESILGAEHPNTAESLSTLAGIYYRQGKYEQAESLCRRALAILENSLGAEHPNTAKIMNNLAALYIKQGKYEQAESLCRRALAVQEKILGTEHPDTARLLHMLAEILQVQRQHEQSEVLYQRALSIREQLLGAMHPDTQFTKRAYDDFLQSIGRDAEAAALEVNDEPSV